VNKLLPSFSLPSLVDIINKRKRSLIEEEELSSADIDNSVLSANDFFNTGYNWKSFTSSHAEPLRKNKNRFKFLEVIYNYYQNNKKL
jgi:hypothetical protein